MQRPGVLAIPRDFQAWAELAYCMGRSPCAPHWRNLHRHTDRPQSRVPTAAELPWSQGEQGGRRLHYLARHARNASPRN